MGGLVAGHGGGGHRARRRAARCRHSGARAAHPVGPAQRGAARGATCSRRAGGRAATGGPRCSSRCPGRAALQRTMLWHQAWVCSCKKFVEVAAASVCSVRRLARVITLLAPPVSTPHSARTRLRASPGQQAQWPQGWRREARQGGRASRPAAAGGAAAEPPPPSAAAAGPPAAACQRGMSPSRGRRAAGDGAAEQRRRAHG